MYSQYLMGCLSYPANFDALLLLSLHACTQLIFEIRTLAGEEDGHLVVDGVDELEGEVEVDGHRVHDDEEHHEAVLNQGHNGLVARHVEDAVDGCSG